MYFKTFYIKISLILFVVFLFLILRIESLNADSLPSYANALKTLFPDLRVISEQKYGITRDIIKNIKTEWKVRSFSRQDTEVVFYKAESNGNIKYACIDRVKGKWGPITYAVLLSSKGIIEKVEILDMKERRGNKIYDKNFLGRFTGKFIDKQNPDKIGVDSVSGATISSKAVINGIKRVLALFHVLYHPDQTGNK